MGGEQARWRPGRKRIVAGATSSAQVRALHPPQLLPPLDEPSHLLRLLPASTPRSLSALILPLISVRVTVQRWSSSPVNPPACLCLRSRPPTALPVSEQAVSCPMASDPDGAAHPFSCIWNLSFY